MPRSRTARHGVWLGGGCGHVIRAIVEMIDPRIGETIYDPAAGTAGFLVAAYNHIRLANSSPDGIEEVELDGKRVRRGWGDKLSTAIIAANRVFELETSDAKKYCPTTLLDIRNIIAEAFKTQKWDTLLTRNRKLLQMKSNDFTDGLNVKGDF